MSRALRAIEIEGVDETKLCDGDICPWDEGSRGYRQLSKIDADVTTNQISGLEPYYVIARPC